MGASKIWVVGVGPGAPDLITQRVASLIRSADYVAGFHSTLGVIRHLVRGEAVELDYRNQDAVIQRIADLSKRGYSCVVCTFGDPNVSDSQLVDRLFSAGVETEIVPGISSVQVGCARLGLPFDASILVTFHKRGAIEEDKEELLELVLWGKRNIIVLPRPWDFMPSEIAMFLLSKHVEPSREIVVLQNMTLANESLFTCSLEELARIKETFSDLTILVIKAGLNGCNTGYGAVKFRGGVSLS
ncbi:MAG: precorrin-6y C5,15-methyltransferase (decarboxylating) subunit CbiE [Thermoprotei archaeon]